MLYPIRQHRTDLHRRLASQYSSLEASHIRVSRLPLSIGQSSYLQRKHGRTFSGHLSWNAAHPERPFWKLRDTEKIDLELKESRRNKGTSSSIDVPTRTTDLGNNEPRLSDNETR
jgi:hypothetical protein